MVIEKIFKVYTFDELSENVKKYLIETERENIRSQESEYLTLSDDLKFSLQNKLKDNGIECLNEDKLKLYYSLNNCQGYGVCFEGIFKNNNNNTSYMIKHSGHYHHYNSKDIELYDVTEGLELTYDEAKDLIDSFNSLYVYICKELEKEGYDLIEADDEYQLSEENIKEKLLLEYYYLEDGTKFNY